MWNKSGKYSDPLTVHRQSWSYRTYIMEWREMPISEALLCLKRSFVVVPFRRTLLRGYSRRFLAMSPRPSVELTGFFWPEVSCSSVFWSSLLWDLPICWPLTPQCPLSPNHHGPSATWHPLFGLLQQRPVVSFVCLSVRSILSVGLSVQVLLTRELAYTWT